MSKANASVELGKIRGLAWYRARRLTYAAVASEMRISASTLALFLNGGTPGPRTRQRLEAWYAAAHRIPYLPLRSRARPEDDDLGMRMIAIDLLLEDFPRQTREELRGLLLWVLLRLHDEHGIPIPPALPVLLDAVRSHSGDSFLSAFKRLKA